MAACGPRVAYFQPPPPLSVHGEYKTCDFSSSREKRRRRDQSGADRRVTDRQADGRRAEAGLTIALLQLDAVAHVDVVDPDVASGRVIKESLEHHLDTRHGDVKKEPHAERRRLFDV